MTDSFTIISPSTIQGFNFAFWLLPGRHFDLRGLGCGECKFCLDLGSGTALGPDLTSSFMKTNQYGYNIWDIGVTGLNIPVSGGSPDAYCLTLENAVVSSGDPSTGTRTAAPLWRTRNVFKMAQGCIPSESFNIVGIPISGTTPEPSSIILFGSGIFGLTGVLRRRML